MVDTHYCAYIAGFFDGEGTCSLNKSLKQKPHHVQSYHVSVILSNTNHAVLLEMQQTLCLGTLYKKEGQQKNWKASYHLDFPKLHVVKFLKLILPYLRIKKRQAELVIEFCEELQREGNEVTEAKVQRRKLIYEELLELNKRGLD